MNEGRLTLHDGRTLALREYGPAGGRPILRFQGMPSSRMSRHPLEDSYERLGARVVVADRPGYGDSTRLAGRGISAVADDAAALLDVLGLEEVRAIGVSRGGPHVLAFASRYPELVRAVGVVVGAAPLEEGDVAGLISLNRAGWYAARSGWDAMFALLSPVREDLLRDPLEGFRAVMDAAPQSGREVMDDPAWQRVMIEDTREALRPGVRVGPTRRWQSWGHGTLIQRTFGQRHLVAGEDDANAPLAATKRLVSRMPTVELRTWAGDVGHLEAYRRHDEILAELLTR